MGGAMGAAMSCGKFGALQNPRHLFPLWTGNQFDSHVRQCGSDLAETRAWFVKTSSFVEDRVGFFLQLSRAPCRRTSDVQEVDDYPRGVIRFCAYIYIYIYTCFNTSSSLQVNDLILLELVVQKHYSRRSV